MLYKALGFCLVLFSVVSLAIMLLLVAIDKEVKRLDQVALYNCANFSDNMTEAQLKKCEELRSSSSDG